MQTQNFKVKQQFIAFKLNPGTPPTQPGKEEMRLDIEDIIVGRELLYGQVTSRDLKVEVVLKLDGFANLT